LIARTTPPPSAARWNTLELAPYEHFGEIDDLQPVAGVGTIDAEPVHGLLVSHPGERLGNLHADALLESLGEQALDQLENVLLSDEGCLDVYLGEFGLAVGAKILIAKTTSDLEVALHSRHHEQLLVLLRRLRQRIELSRAQPAGNEEVPGAFGGLLDKTGVSTSTNPLLSS